MVQRNVMIMNPTGLHLRPAAVLAKEAGKCESDITILFGNKTLNAKSSLNIMAAAIKKGAEITVVCEGETEEKDLEAMVGLIESGLGE